ncbi:hypothetical protein [uncultured Methanospirillum sp.]|uniref:hypothetical protein n=1 Tax=uncultured Methanospirillum sp. TaxID=262503 RepID=UPI0029C614A1|nr:hypothetical protein [uncultured Methanospirillum sp.]
MSVVRKLTVPIADLTTFNALVQDILDNNPWGCVSYVSAGVTVAAVVKGTESYTGAVVYEDAQAKTVGRISVKAPTSTGFTTNVSTIVGTAALGTAMGGTPSHDRPKDTFCVTLKCHHKSGENFSVTLKRDSVTVSSYEADAIRTGLEAWADTVAVLA